MQAQAGTPPLLDQSGTASRKQSLGDGDTSVAASVQSSPYISSDLDDYHLAVPASESLPGGPSSSSPSVSRNQASAAQVEESLEFRNATWEKLLNNVFKGLPNNEPLFVDHICAFQGEHILQQGKLYLTPNYFCFYANIFGYVTIHEFPIKDIVLIERAKTAMIIPNAITIVTSSKSYTFSSFINRENAYANMEYLISRYRESLRKAFVTPPATKQGILKNNSAERFDDLLISSPSTNKQILPKESENRIQTDLQAPLGPESDVELVLNSRSIAALAIMVLAIALCMLLAVGSTMILWKIKSVIGRLEQIAESL